MCAGTVAKSKSFVIFCNIIFIDVIKYKLISNNIKYLFKKMLFVQNRIYSDQILVKYCSIVVNT